MVNGPPGMSTSRGSDAASAGAAGGAAAVSAGAPLRS